jgi:hypothetical protein
MHECYGNPSYEGRVANAWFVIESHTDYSHQCPVEIINP